jgi:hypothetical protein
VTVDRVLAIAGLRLKLLARQSRGGSAAVRIIAAALAALLAGFIALALAAVFGLATYHFVRDGDPASIRGVFLLVFYSCFFLGVALPTVIGATGKGFDAAPFRVFPISRARLYAITLLGYGASGEHLLYYPALLTVCVTGILLPQVNPAAGLAAMLLALLFYVAWGNAIVLFLVGLMRRRRLREVLAIVTFVLLFGASMAPSLLRGPDLTFDGEAAPFATALLDAVVAVGAVLPPTLAADCLTALHVEGALAALPDLFWLLVWDGAGLLLGYAAFQRHLGEREPRRRARKRAGPPVSRSRRAAWLSVDHPALSFIPREIRAVAAKELRYLLRSVIGKFNLVMVPVFVVVVVFVIATALTGSLFGLPSDSTLLLGLLLYSTLFSNNFINNAFAWDNDGLRCYFLSPAPTNRILAGKNLAVWAYNAILWLIVIVSWSVIKSIPDPWTLVTAALLFGVSVLFFTTVGNVVSVLFPARRDIASMTNTPSTVAIFLSLASLLTAAALVGLFLFLPVLLGVPRLQPLFLFNLLLLEAIAYVLVLRFAGRLMLRRRSSLIDTLTAPE